MNTKVVRVLGLLIAAAGLAVLLSMGPLTEAAGHAIMLRNGGSMDTNTYMAQLQLAGAAYRAIGAVALAVGLFRATAPEKA